MKRKTGSPWLMLIVAHASAAVCAANRSTGFVARQISTNAVIGTPKRDSTTSTGSRLAEMKLRKTGHILPVGPRLTIQRGDSSFVAGTPNFRLLSKHLDLTAMSASLSTVASSPDPQDFEELHLWLEEVEGEQALDWVGDQNSNAILALGDPKLDPLHSRLLSIYDSKDKIPYIRKIGPWLYNFWKDEQNVRGIWRRTTLSSFRNAKPDWDIVLDLDKLGKEEGISWVWGGAVVLREDGKDPERVLVSLSRGGSDATVIREFDLMCKDFVAASDGGFVLPEGKSDVSWQARDVLIVGTNFGPGSLTDSGYPRVVKEWKRGTPLSEATGDWEGEKTDVAASGFVTRHGGVLQEWRVRSTTFYTSKAWVRPLLRKSGRSSEWKEVPVPDHASVSPFKGHLLVSLRKDWLAGGVLHPAGSLLSCKMDEVMEKGAGANFVALFTPDERCSLNGWERTKDFLVLTLLNNVRTQLQFWKLDESKGWQQQPKENSQCDEGIRTISVSAVDSEDSDKLWQTSYSYTEPPTLSVVNAEAGGAGEEALKSLPHQFNADGLSVSQGEAISADGTKVPYFLVRRTGAALDGSLPTLLYSYGGFEVSLTPGYSAEVGAAWLERGGAYVVANIRGGGEFGPTWHQAALREKRQRAYDDFFAVAESLIETGVTTRERLGIRGGSNGGLLVGNALVQRPDLWGAVVCAVPLLDMKRYHTLLAGASWMAEYGDPDTSDWEDFLYKYSPYHRVDPNTKYPPVLFTTSTRDDRVHPAHARKMVKRMAEAGKGKTTFYYENIEGGHGGAADSKQQAFMSTLVYNFLWQTLSAK